MAFNVCDKNGAHIGIIMEKYPLTRDAYVVALTDLKTQDITIDYDGIKKHLSPIYDCETVFGRVKEERLNQVLKELWRDSFSHYGDFDYEYILRRLLLTYGLEVSEHVRWDFSTVRGYVLIDGKNLEFYSQDYVIIRDTMDYLDLEEGLSDEPYVYGKIIDYPVIEVDVMGVGEGFLLGANFSDFGGRNHVHHTKLIIQSGNITRTVIFQIPLYVRKGMKILLHVKDNKIRRIFCDGIIYNLGDNNEATYYEPTINVGDDSKDNPKTPEFYNI